MGSEMCIRDRLIKSFQPSLIPASFAAFFWVSHSGERVGMTQKVAAKEADFDSSFSLSPAGNGDKK